MKNQLKTKVLSSKLTDIIFTEKSLKQEENNGSNCNQVTFITARDVTKTSLKNHLLQCIPQLQIKGMSVITISKKTHSKADLNYYFKTGTKSSPKGCKKFIVSIENYVEVAVYFNDNKLEVLNEGENI